MNLRWSSDEVTSYRYLLSLSLLATFGWFGTCLLLGKPEHAHRGGALGVGLSFVAYFLAPSYGKLITDVLEARGGDLGELYELVELDGAEEHPLAVSHGQQSSDDNASAAMFLRKQWYSDLDGIEIQNRYIAWAAFSGTIMNGFGDWFALYFLKALDY